jgi:hypothetical protein
LEPFSNRIPHIMVQTQYWGVWWMGFIKTSRPFLSHGESLNIFNSKELGALLQDLCSTSSSHQNM